MKKSQLTIFMTPSDLGQRNTMCQPPNDTRIAHIIPQKGYFNIYPSKINL